MSLEHQLQINVISKILRRSLHKLRISLILPKIFENVVAAQQSLNGSKYSDCIGLIKEYIKEKNKDSSNIYPLLSHRLIQIIDFFHENMQVLAYFNDWLDDLSPFDKCLVESFELLLMITEQRLNKSAISELEREKKVHEVYQENEKLKMKIKVFESVLKSRRINFKWKQTAEEVLIDKYEKDLAKCRYDNNIKIKQEIVRSSHNIRQIHAGSAAKQKELGEELERLRNVYEHLLKGNLEQEKSIRDERNKLLFQLQGLLKKFDQTMSDKINENMNLQEEYKKEAFDLFLIEYNREEAEYTQIVREKEEEEKRLNEEKIMLFMMNRSARVIQKHWRKYNRVQKKTSKRNKGRGKLKKK